MHSAMHQVFVRKKRLKDKNLIFFQMRFVNILKRRLGFFVFRFISYTLISFKTFRVIALLFFLYKAS